MTSTSNRSIFVPLKTRQPVALHAGLHLGDAHVPGGVEQRGARRGRGGAAAAGGRRRRAGSAAGAARVAAATEQTHENGVWSKPHVEPRSGKSARAPANGAPRPSPPRGLRQCFIVGLTVRAAINPASTEFGSGTGDLSSSPPSERSPDAPVASANVRVDQFKLTPPRIRAIFAAFVEVPARDVSGIPVWPIGTGGHAGPVCEPPIVETRVPRSRLPPLTPTLSSAPSLPRPSAPRPCVARRSDADRSLHAQRVPHREHRNPRARRSKSSATRSRTPTCSRRRSPTPPSPTTASTATSGWSSSATPCSTWSSARRCTCKFPAVPGGRPDEDQVGRRLAPDLRRGGERDGPGRPADHRQGHQLAQHDAQLAWRRRCTSRSSRRSTSTAGSRS